MCYSLAVDSDLLTGEREKVGMLNVGRRKEPYDMHLQAGASQFCNSEDVLG